MSINNEKYEVRELKIKELLETGRLLEGNRLLRDLGLLKVLVRE